MLPLSEVAEYNGFTGSVLPQESILGQQLMRKLGCLKASYKPVRDGGAAGTITFKNMDDGSAASLPVGAIVLDAKIYVKTVPVGSGASIAVQLQGADDIVAAAAINGAPWSTTGLKQGVPDWASVSDAVTVATTAKTLSAVVTSATLTDGEIQAYLFYILTE